MLEIKHCSKSYGKQKILDNVTITFPSSGMFAIVGKSGSGKTTLLNIISSLDRADLGDISIDGIEYSKCSSKQLAEIRKNLFSFVFQDSFLLDELTVNENIRTVDILSPVGLKSDDETADIINTLGIENLLDKPANCLSGGERQRVAIARALVKGCKIILADEPTGNLDRGNSENIYDILKQLSKNYLVIMVTHDAEGAAYADQIIDIHDLKDCNYNFSNSEKQENAQMPSHSNKVKGSVVKKLKFGTSLCLKKKKLFIPSIIVFMLFMIVMLIFSDLAFINPHYAEYNLYSDYGVKSVSYNLWDETSYIADISDYNDRYDKLEAGCKMKLQLLRS